MTSSQTGTTVKYRRTEHDKDQETKRIDKNTNFEDSTSHLLKPSKNYLLDPRSSTSLERERTVMVLIRLLNNNIYILDLNS